MPLSTGQLLNVGLSGSWLGIDIGGSAWKWALIEDGAVAAAGSGPISKSSDGESAIKSIGRTLAAKVDVKTLRGAGLALPGLVDDGVLVGAANLPSWSGTDAQAVLEACFPCPVVALSDSAAAGFAARAVEPAARGILSLSLGTGIGTALVVGDEVLPGAGGQASVRLTDGPLRNQVLESELGTGAVLTLAREHAPEGSALADAVDAGCTPADIARLADAGDGHALAVWDQFGKRLGRTAANLAVLLLVDRVVVSGGLTQAGPLVTTPAMDAFDVSLHPGLRSRIRLTFSPFREYAGAVGTALAAQALTAAQVAP